MKMFCFVVNFFIWIIKKNDWCDIKSVKKLKYFWFDIFKRSEKKIRENDNGLPN
jgi:hypothetical protein